MGRLCLSSPHPYRIAGLFVCPGDEFHDGEARRSASGAISFVLGHGCPAERPDAFSSGWFKTAYSLPRLEEVVEPRVVAEHPIDDLSAVSDDLARDPDHRLQEPAELHPEKIL